MFIDDVIKKVYGLTESAESEYKLKYKITYLHDVYSRTEDTAEMDMQDEDFGDLEDVDWTVEDVTEMEDGRRNDMVRVTYEVTGTVIATVNASDLDAAKEQAEEELKEEDLGPVDEPDDMEFEFIDVISETVLESEDREIAKPKKKIIDLLGRQFTYTDSYVFKDGAMFRNVAAGLIDDKRRPYRVAGNYNIYIDSFPTAALPYSTYYIADKETGCVYRTEVLQGMSDQRQYVKDLVEYLKSHKIG